MRAAYLFFAIHFCMEMHDIKGPSWEKLLLALMGFVGLWFATLPRSDAADRSEK